MILVILYRVEFIPFLFTDQNLPLQHFSINISLTLSTAHICITFLIIFKGLVYIITYLSHKWHVWMVVRIINPILYMRKWKYQIKWLIQYYGMKPISQSNLSRTHFIIYLVSHMFTNPKIKLMKIQVTVKE